MTLLAKHPTIRNFISKNVFTLLLIFLASENDVIFTTRVVYTYPIKDILKITIFDI